MDFSTINAELMEIGMYQKRNADNLERIADSLERIANVLPTNELAGDRLMDIINMIGHRLASD